MKYFVDEKGDRYQIDRATGEQILIQPAGSETGGAGAPEQTGEPTETNED